MSRRCTKCDIHYVKDEELVRDCYGGICSVNPRTGMIIRSDNHGISKHKLDVGSAPYIHERKGIVTEIRRISFTEMEVVSYHKYHQVSADRFYLKANNY